MIDNFETAAMKNEERGDRKYARQLRAAGTIVHTLVKEALKRGYTVSVYDSEEWTVNKSTNENEIREALFTTDMDTLKLRHADGSNIGNILLVYGNDGPDVVSDYHTAPEIEAIMDEIITPLADRLEARIFG
jgi:hypothetical protein